MKKVYFALGLIAVAASAQAQNLKEAIKKVGDERYSEARADFQALIKANPTSIDNAFYFGNFYQKIEKLDSAAYWWKKSSEVMPTDKLAMIGNYKAMYVAGDTATASNGFCTILKATKYKNVIGLMRIAEAYGTSGKWSNYKLAESYSNKALEIDPNNIDLLMLSGDIKLKTNGKDASPAVAQYNKILQIDPKNIQAIVKKAKIYEAVGNFKLAHEEYLRAESIDPNYAPLYYFHGQLNNRFSKFKDASKYFEKYLSFNRNENGLFGYMVSLNGEKRFADGLKIAQELEKMYPDNIYVLRYLSLDYYESNDAKDLGIYEKALMYSDKFFAKAKNEEYVTEDFTERAKIFAALGKNNEAVEAYRKAFEFKPEIKGDMLSEIGKLYVKLKQPANFVRVMEEKKAIAELTALELLDLGKAYYFGDAANGFPADFKKAEETFVKLTQVSPTYPTGFIYVARSLQKQDDPKALKWIAKPAYENYLAQITAENSLAEKAGLIEANRYLGVYYQTMKDTAKATEYFTKVKELDANDPAMKSFFGIK